MLTLEGAVYSFDKNNAPIAHAANGDIVRFITQTASVTRSRPKRTMKTIWILPIPTLPPGRSMWTMRMWAMCWR